MAAALLSPIILLLFGIIFPLRLAAAPNHKHLIAMLDYPLIRVALLGVCVLALFHYAYRFYYILRDGFLLKHPKWVIIGTGYIGAIIGSVIAGYILLRT